MLTRTAMTQAAFRADHASTGPREIVRLLKRAQAIHVTRRQLAELEPRLLQDIGALPADAIREARRAPWDIEPRGPHPRRPNAGGGIEAKLDAAWSAWRAAMRRWRSRQLIADLDQHALRDIGVTYADAEREANKPFWQR